MPDGNQKSALAFAPDGKMIAFPPLVRYHTPVPHNNKTIEFGCGQSTDTDAYRAGTEAASAAIGAIVHHAPSCIFIFASVAYDIQRLLDGVADTIGDSCPIIGSSTAVELCGTQLSSGVVVSVIASPHMTVSAAVGQGVSRDWRQAFTECTQSPAIARYIASRDDTGRDLALRGRSAFALMFSPGNTRHAPSRAYELTEEFSSRTAGRYPLIGACCADDWNLKGNFAILGRRAYRDAMVMAFVETGLTYGIGCDHGFEPTRDLLRVGRCDDHEVLELNGKPSILTLAELSGRSVDDLRSRHFTQFTSTPFGYLTAMGNYALCVGSFFTERGGLLFSQPLVPGTLISRMDFTMTTLQTAGVNAVRKAVFRGSITDPAALILFPCALRVTIPGYSATTELDHIHRLLPGIPTVGFFSFGEQALGDDGIARHNNGTFAALAFGSSRSPLSRMAEKRLKYEHIINLQREIAVNLSLATTVEDAFKALMDGLCATGEFDCGGAYLYRAEEQALELVHHFGLGDAFIASSRRYVKDSVHTLLVTAGQPLYLSFDDLTKRTGRKGEPAISGERLRSTAVIPLRSEGRIIGSLNMASHQVDVTNTSVRTMLESVAGEATAVLERIIAMGHITSSRNNFDTLFNAINDFVFIIDATGMVIETNRVVEDRLGYGRDEITRMHAVDFHPPERRAEAAGVIALMLQGSRDLCEIPLQGKDGTLIPVETRIVRGRWNDREALFGVSRDITERKRIEDALRRSTREYDELAAAVPVGIYRVTLQENGDPVFTFVNQRWCEINGMTLEDVRERPWMAIELAHPDEREEFIRRNMEAYNTRSAFSWEGRFVIEGAPRYLHIESRPTRLDDGRFIWNGIVYDITERTLMERALADSEKKYRFITENMNDIVWTVDLDLRTTYVSPSIYKILGFTPAERLQQPLSEMVTPASLAEIADRFNDEMLNERAGADPNRAISMEVEYVRKDGATLWMLDRVLAMRDEAGTLLGLYGVSQDISERKRAEEALKASLAEKEALLHEVNHRVKNNMSIISSVIGLQKQQIQEGETASALDDLQARVITMATVHDMLSTSTDVRQIDLAPYLRGITRSVARSLEQPSERITMVLDLDEAITLPTAKAVTIGLIVNELLTNSLKYAFTEGGTGTIRIALSSDNASLRLTYQDSGPGLPDGYDPLKATTLGMLLVHTLAKQLDAQLQLTYGKGWSIVIICPL